jgi:hypothetical protein
MREVDGLVGGRALDRLEGVGKNSQKTIGVKGGKKKNQKEA